VIRIQAAPPEHHPWIAERAGLALHSGFMAIEAVDDTGRVLGMVGFDGWMPQAVCLHIAIEEPIVLRRLLPAAFGVAFGPPPGGFAKAAAIATVLSTNEKSLELVRRVGFQKAYVGHDWSGPGVDFCVFEMRREWCRFIPAALRRVA
jgi:RimJ/RimL family protein N-acetyltransferase